MADHPETTSSTATRVLGIASLASIAVLVIYAFAVTGPDVRLGETVRIMYVHVPTVSIAYLFMLANAVCSVMFLVKRSSFFDVAAGASGEIGVVLLGLTLVTGMLWGRPTWGAYWVWDARLTSMLILLFLYFGVIASPPQRCSSSCTSVISRCGPCRGTRTCEPCAPRLWGSCRRR